jgi:hypothetical protein
MAHVRVQVGTRESFTRQVSPATQLLPVVAMVHLGQVSIEGAPQALRALAAELVAVADEADQAQLHAESV